jgi:hypothetical protein
VVDGGALVVVVTAMVEAVVRDVGLLVAVFPACWCGVATDDERELSLIPR